ncbi:hypothetical protein QQF64_021689 [Cirrhinus molitorella]|uniref:Secreted protein n=1 Tax=Cirrhinus molitorella TaxID=172907 RepID=A0ABR3L8C9_9TELE
MRNILRLWPTGVLIRCGSWARCVSITYGVLMGDFRTRWALVFRDLQTITHDKENSRRTERASERERVATLRVGSGEGAVCAGAAVDAVARSPGEGKASGAELMLISGENWEILFVKAAPKHSQPQKI